MLSPFYIICYVFRLRLKYSTHTVTEVSQPDDPTEADVAAEAVVAVVIFHRVERVEHQILIAQILRERAAELRSEPVDKPAPKALKQAAAFRIIHLVFHISTLLQGCVFSLRLQNSTPIVTKSAQIETK